MSDYTQFLPRLRIVFACKNHRSARVLAFCLLSLFPFANAIFLHPHSSVQRNTTTIDLDIRRERQACELWACSFIWTKSYSQSFNSTGQLWFTFSENSTVFRGPALQVCALCCFVPCVRKRGERRQKRYALWILKKRNKIQYHRHRVIECLEILFQLFKRAWNCWKPI